MRAVDHPTLTATAARAIATAIATAIDTYHLAVVRQGFGTGAHRGTRKAARQAKRHLKAVYATHEGVLHAYELTHPCTGNPLPATAADAIRQARNRRTVHHDRHTLRAEDH